MNSTRSSGSPIEAGYFELSDRSNIRLLAAVLDACEKNNVDRATAEAVAVDSLSIFKRGSRGP
ncbi:hypothetical protein [Roseivivax isoporae]|uniref:Uncharacterized protein n=1 Tax=Roseivivax isoporae LMG 25204 TaxID=1449351 RepID=X7F9F8_9RHOB|nr:hypothetical protein [Roseivivax isoporae]ETX29435.1 hypothetical protein RISW2_23150 [Roseivivax isoporae LMG 25204]